MICLIKKNIIFISLAQIQVNLAVPTLMLIYSLLRFLTGTFCIMKPHFFHLGLILLCNPVQGSLGAVSIRKTVLPGMAIPMLKIRRPTWKLPYVDKTVSILRRGPDPFLYPPIVLEYFAAVPCD